MFIFCRQTFPKRKIRAIFWDFKVIKEPKFCSFSVRFVITFRLALCVRYLPNSFLTIMLHHQMMICARNLKLLMTPLFQESGRRKRANLAFRKYKNTGNVCNFFLATNNVSKTLVLNGKVF